MPIQNREKAGTMVEGTEPGQFFEFCPRCGESGLILKPTFDFRCDHCGFHYFINAAGAVVALIHDVRGRLLLTRRAKSPAEGTLDLPGGFIDPMETAEDALIREIREELNLNITGWRYLGSFPNRYVFDGVPVFTVDLAFSCNVTSFESLKAGDDVADVVFVAPDRIRLSAIGLDSVREIVRVCGKVST